MQRGLGELHVHCPALHFTAQRRAVARHSVAAGDTLLTVPDSSVMTAPTAAALAARLAHHLKHPERSQWREYLAFLPASLPGVPALWPAHSPQRALLAGTATLQRADEEEATAAAACDGSTPIARALVAAYSFNLGPQDAPIPAMVPLYDALNHRHGMCNVRKTHDPEAGHLAMVATHSIAKGQELVNDYGKLGSAQLLRMYGFVEQEVCRAAAVWAAEDSSTTTAPSFTVAAPGGDSGCANGDQQYGNSSSSSSSKEANLRRNPYDSVEVELPGTTRPPRARCHARILRSGLPEPETRCPSGLPGLRSAVEAALARLEEGSSGARHPVWWLERACLQACLRKLDTASGRQAVAARLVASDPRATAAAMQGRAHAAAAAHAARHGTDDNLSFGALRRSPFRQRAAARPWPTSQVLAASAAAAGWPRLWLQPAESGGGTAAAAAAVRVFRRPQPLKSFHM